MTFYDTASVPPKIEDNLVVIESYTEKYSISFWLVNQNHGVVQTGLSDIPLNPIRSDLRTDVTCSCCDSETDAYCLGAPRDLTVLPTPVLSDISMDVVTGLAGYHYYVCQHCIETYNQLFHTLLEKNCAEVVSTKL